MESRNKLNTFFYEKFIPVFLLSSVGAFSWAIRGCAGYGTIKGCVFVGSILSAVWLFLSREKSMIKTRRYNMGWIVFALVFGIGIGGMRGWSQFPQWCNGIWHVHDYDWNYYVLVNPAWGYGWLFIAGSAWAGMGAILIAWAGNKVPLKRKDWIIRLSLGIGCGLLAGILFKIFPQWFVPLYDILEYDDFNVCTECFDALEDNFTSLVFFAVFFGFLLFEILRKDWMNVKLILIISMISGVSWIFFMFLGTDDVWWRVWEGSAGLGIGLSYGIAFIFCNKPLNKNDPNQRIQSYSNHPNLEKGFGIYLTYFFGMGWVTHQMVQGFSDIYLGFATPKFNITILLPWAVFGLTFLGYIVWKSHLKPYIPGDHIDNVPEFNFIFLSVYIALRLYGFMVTGPLTNSWELGFFVFYAIQFAIESVFLILYWNYKKDSRLKD